MANDSPRALRGASIYQVFVRNQSEDGTFDAALPALDKAKEFGFDYVYLTPIHPVGKAARKGSLGSPYAIADYRAVDPALGGEAGFRRFLDAAHAKNLRILMDVVYNHTSPDSVLARERPDWFWKGPEGKPAPRVADWSDVVDLDYGRPGLWDYQIETLEAWFRFGVDGFRCDVASLVPVPFWVEARRRLALAAEAAGRESCLWLAESVHKEFVAELRARGLYAASDAELHEAFDLSYDYDGRPELEAAWAGAKPLSAYLHHLFLQDCMLPATAVKLRFLENHDQPRAASLFGRGARLRCWTLFAMLLPGAFLAYSGEELALTRRPSLFDKDPLDRAAGDRAFEAWFGKAHLATKGLRAAAPRFSARELAAGLVLIERKGEGRGTAALLNLDGRAGKIALPEPVAGLDLLSGAHVSLSGTVEIPEEPLLVELGL